jgi:1,4-alpha-glucan branching enzyme
MTTQLPVPTSELDLLVAGEHGHPHAILGPHPHDDGVTIRAFKPLATSVEVVIGDDRVALAHEHEGIWVGVVPGTDVPGYRLAVSYDGPAHVVDDPYRFLPTLGEMDLHLAGEGRHEELYGKLGAHVVVHQGVRGTAFAVWAPSARSVSVVGDFNSWDGRLHPMRSLGSSGIWELFLPGVGSGANYKYEILASTGEIRL